MVIEGSTTPSPYVLYIEGYSFTKPVDQLVGVKWNVCCDSIPAGLNATKPYTTVISERAGVTTRNYGVSGSRFSSDAEKTHSMTQRFSTMMLMRI